MRSNRPFALYAVALLFALSLTACGTPPSDSPTADPGTASPMNDKDSFQAEQWAKATQGLDFDTRDGLVEVSLTFPRNSATAAQHLSQGNELIDTNHVMDALEQFGLAARNDPDLADAYVGIGRVLKRKGKLDPALASFRTALDRDDDNLPARYQLAMTLWASSEQDGAIEQMNALLDIDDAYAMAHERLAVWNYYTGSYDDAWRHLHRAEALGLDVPQHFVPLLQEKMPDPGA